MFSGSNTKKKWTTCKSICYSIPPQNNDVEVNTATWSTICRVLGPEKTHSISIFCYLYLQKCLFKKNKKSLMGLIILLTSYGRYKIPLPRKSNKVKLQSVFVIRDSNSHTWRLLHCHLLVGYLTLQGSKSLKGQIHSQRMRPYWLRLEELLPFCFGPPSPLGPWSIQHSLLETARSFPFPG